MAEKIQNIYQKLNNFRVKVEAIRKDKENPYHKSKYADINTILETITDKLSEVDLIDVDTTKIDENGQLWLETKLININNPEEFLKIETPLLMKDKNNPQALGSALTYARRYNRVTLLGLEQEDDDGNTAAGKGQDYPEPEKQQVKTKKMTPRQQFLEFIAKEGIDAKHLNDFTNWMITAGYDIKNDDVKISLLNQDIKLKKLIRAYLDTLTQTQ